MDEVINTPSPAAPVAPSSSEPSKAEPKEDNRKEYYDEEVMEDEHDMVIQPQPLHGDSIHADKFEVDSVCSVIDINLDWPVFNVGMSFIISVIGGAGSVTSLSGCGLQYGPKSGGFSLFHSVMLPFEISWFICLPMCIKGFTYHFTTEDGVLLLVPCNAVAKA